MKKLKKYLIPFLFCSIFFLVPKTFCANPPAFNQIQNLGMGVGSYAINCSNAMANCFFMPEDFSLSNTGDLHTGQINLLSYFVSGITTSYYNSEVFVPGYIYIYTLQVYDNASSLDYYKGWSWQVNTGYDNDYGGVNKYADIKRIEITKTGNNYSINIYFTVNEWTRYFRVAGRAPYSYNDNIIFPSKDNIKQDYPLISYTYADDKFYFRYANYGFAAMTDYEYQAYLKQQEIANNTGETNNKLDDLNDNITNSDTTGSQNTANGFFNNFNTDDNGGISAIVTAPLRAINSMVDGTCQPLTATWRGKTISLPCGTEFWDKMSPIRTFLNVIEGGIICYGILVDLYKMINRMKDPEDDRVDVMKL